MQEQSKATIVCDTDDPRKKITFYMPYDEAVSVLRQHLSAKRYAEDLKAGHEGGYISSWDYWSEGEVR